jgi:hypothetical protein
MRKRLMLLVSILFVLMSAGWALAQDVNLDGEWVFTMPTPQGEMAAKLVLKTDGEKLSGTFTFEGDRKLEIEKGTVKGNKLDFTVKRDRPQGGVMIYKMTGTVEGSQIKGSTETDMDGQNVTSDWSAKRK